MNIFYLSEDPTQCAIAHNDKHCVKMILEYAQLLSTAHYLLGSHDKENMYKPTHVNHPSAIWARASSGNYNWLFALFECLCGEYTYRYNKVHATSRLLPHLRILPSAIKTGEFFSPPQCMPEQYKNDDAVVAYKKYYIGEKAKMSTWKNRPIPQWFTSSLHAFSA
jgi:hypothetical protein